MSDWDFRWQDSKNPPSRPVPGRWRRPRSQGRADCFPGNVSAGSAGGDLGADLPWQGELRPGQDIYGQQVTERLVAPQVRRRHREPDDTFPLPPWPRPSAATAKTTPVRSDDGRDEHN